MLKKFYCQKIKLASTFALAVVSFTSGSIPLEAIATTELAKTPVNHSNFVRSQQRSSLRVQFVPPLPPNQDAPSGRRRGGASRCLDCQSGNLPLTALVPGEHSKSFLTLTVAEHPTFWFYVPALLKSESSVEFVLQDDKDRYIYKTTFTAPRTAQGVISISLPSTATPLEIGKRYYWTFLVQDAGSAFVKGVVQRTALNSTVTSQLETATPQERVTLYAANGIWHDALTTLAELRRSHPQDPTFTNGWVNLLQSVGLGDVATAPFIECCTTDIAEAPWKVRTED